MKKMMLMAGLMMTLCSFHWFNQWTLALPEHFPAPIFNFADHPLATKKVALGRQLFYDPALSADGTISCSSCHLSYTGFAHIDHQLSHGIGNRIGLRNASALVNLAWTKHLMWDGSIDQLTKQARTPIVHPDEMGHSMPALLAGLQGHPTYQKAFLGAYGTKKIAEPQLLDALSQFMLTLVSAGSKYDQVAQGQARFSEAEEKGKAVFMQHCNHCHTAPLFTNNGFANNGLVPDTSLNDWGRQRVTGLASDSLKFKVPSLRNVEVTYPYMHDGRFLNLQMVLFHYSDGIHQSPTLAPQLRKALPLTEADKNHLMAFLKTLTDHTFLQNPDHQPTTLYVP